MNSNTDGLSAEKSAPSLAQEVFEAIKYHVYECDEDAVLAKITAAIAARSEAPRDGEGWLPIESAPSTTHHMNQILAFWTGRGVQQTYWDVDEDFANRPKGWRSPACGWRCDGDRCIPVNQDDVTHWRPLPAPPASRKALETSNG